mmetsp:Transcript_16188/g.61343  ORF Transcript_16188/g.61343 Transcript_16188/m.61343 type:complete len:284 (-) Transcript_16188:175-1026(-)
MARGVRQGPVCSGDGIVLWAGQVSNWRRAFGRLRPYRSLGRHPSGGFARQVGRWRLGPTSQHCASRRGGRSGAPADGRGGLGSGPLARPQAGASRRAAPGSDCSSDPSQQRKLRAWRRCGFGAASRRPERWRACRALGCGNRHRRGRRAAIHQGHGYPRRWRRGPAGRGGSRGPCICARVGAACRSCGCLCGKASAGSASTGGHFQAPTRSMQNDQGRAGPRLAGGLRPRASDRSVAVWWPRQGARGPLDDATPGRQAANPELDPGPDVRPRSGGLAAGAGTP